MNVYKLEMKQLRKVEKLIDKLLSYSMPNMWDRARVLGALRNLEENHFICNRDLVDNSYYKYVKKYGNPNLSYYENRILAYTLHKPSAFFGDKNLDANQAEELINYYRSIYKKLEIENPKEFYFSYFN